LIDTLFRREQTPDAAAYNIICRMKPMKWVPSMVKRRIKMTRTKSFDLAIIFGFLAGLMGVVPAFAQSGAQMGKLKIHVRPKQAYVFVDGKAIHEGSQTIKLNPGTHSVGI